MDSGAFEYTSRRNINESKYGFWGVLTRKARALIDEDDGSQKFEKSSRKQPPTAGNTTGGQDSGAFEYTSRRNINESKYGFWGDLTRKARALIDEDDGSQKFEKSSRKQPPTAGNTTGGQRSYRPPEGFRKAEAPFQKKSDKLASSLNHIGGTIISAIDEGLTIVENKTADIIQETRKLNIRRKGNGQNAQNQSSDKLAQRNFPRVQADHELQLKASRDVANAMAAKAKLLLRELKTVKADLAFAKERCAQLEEENKFLRESQKNGASLEDDDMIRLQLETLLSEKARLANENSAYARENRFLREVVEYHQLTMQDVIYVDEGIEEVTEVFSPSANQILLQTNSTSDSSLSTRSLEPQSPAVPVVSSPSHRRPSAIVVPEACPVVPMPPTPSPHGLTRSACILLRGDAV